MTHTPGPWFVEGFHTVQSNGRVSYPSATVICTCRPHPRTPEAHHEAKANARLMAAAPEMLDALKELLRFAGTSQLEASNQQGTSRAKMLARAAIAKAEGK